MRQASKRRPAQETTPAPAPAPNVSAFDARYDDLVAKLQLARAESDALLLNLQELKAAREQLKQEIDQLLTQNKSLVRDMQEVRATLLIKQRVISLLLPHYPHPITPELRWQLDC